MRYAVFFALFVSTTSVAHASVISVPCTENVYSGQSNSGQSSACGAFAAPVGTEITALSYRYSIDFQFNEQNGGSVSLTAALNGNGAADVSGVMLNPLEWGFHRNLLRWSIFSGNRCHVLGDGQFHL